MRKKRNDLESPVIKVLIQLSNNHISHLNLHAFYVSFWRHVPVENVEESGNAGGFVPKVSGVKI